jgi:hypothetical protein
MALPRLVGSERGTPPSHGQPYVNVQKFSLEVALKVSSFENYFERIAAIRHNWKTIS